MPASLTSAIAISPAMEVCYRRALRKIGIEHPVDDEWRVFVRRVLRPYDETPQEIRPILVSTNQYGLYETRD